MKTFFALWLLMACYVAIGLWRDTPDRPPVQQEVAPQAHPTIAAFPTDIPPQEPDPVKFWLQPWFLTLAVSIGLACFVGIWWLRREGWLW